MTSEHERLLAEGPRVVPEAPEAAEAPLGEAAAPVEPQRAARPGRGSRAYSAYLRFGPVLVIFAIAIGRNLGAGDRANLLYAVIPAVVLIAFFALRRRGR
jgi:hypothetical protein